MRLKREDEALGVVATSLIEKKDSPCPSDEEFALYIEKRLNREKRESLISHFVSCRDCRERLTIPIHLMETTKETNRMERLLALFGRPSVLVPVMAVFLIVVAVTLNVYLTSNDTPKERYRGGDLVALKQVDLTPDLLTTIKKGNEEELKNGLIKELPPGSEVSTIVVEEELKSLRRVEGGERIVLILYGNGLLKVRLESNR
jgi:hypothetical protein